MNALFQLIAQGAVIVNLAVKDDPCRSIFVMNRLLSAFEVYDRETPHSKADRAVRVKPIFIGTTMTYGIAHASQHIRVNAGSAAINSSYDSAHFYIFCDG